ncbi:MAG: hypothetical protein SWO11_16155 [Thermodesulfobacteriota bacterium]|nr:hypothetical protein [Thermodesulfobacteriota bacterium]
MNKRKVLENLENLACKLNVEVVYEKLKGEEFFIKSGLCKVHNKYKIFIEESVPTEGRIKILISALCSFNTEDIYLLPFIREILENAVSK